MTRNAIKYLLLLPRSAPTAASRTLSRTLCRSRRALLLVVPYTKTWHNGKGEAPSLECHPFSELFYSAVKFLHTF